MSEMGWIGVDFDATLCIYNGWKGDFTFGQPVPKMVERVKQWLDAGFIVKIMTARASEADEAGRKEIIAAIESWCLTHIGVKLEVTNKKDFKMIQLWDDRAMQVIPNTGESVQELLTQAIIEIQRLEGLLKENV